uniref:OAR domain-containing protein n=1 Tax=Syphacia muris TaxID=451379 RepID=A0A0N5AV31_9BILA
MFKNADCRSSRPSDSVSLSSASLSSHRYSPQVSPNHLRPPQTHMAAAALMRRHKSDYAQYPPLPPADV